MADFKMHILVVEVRLRASHSEKIVFKFKDSLKERNLEKEIKVITTGCFAFAKRDRLLKLFPIILSTLSSS
jgi:hypothetical protein